MRLLIMGRSSWLGAPVKLGCYWDVMLSIAMTTIFTALPGVSREAKPNALSSTLRPPRPSTEPGVSTSVLI